MFVKVEDSTWDWKKIAIIAGSALGGLIIVTIAVVCIVKTVKKKSISSVTVLKQVDQSIPSQIADQSVIIETKGMNR